jgi:hypothetical protein
MKSEASPNTTSSRPQLEEGRPSFSYVSTLPRDAHWGWREPHGRIFSRSADLRVRLSSVLTLHLLPKASALFEFNGDVEPSELDPQSPGLGHTI